MPVTHTGAMGRQPPPIRRTWPAADSPRAPRPHRHSLTIRRLASRALRMIRATTRTLAAPPIATVCQVSVEESIRSVK